MAFPALLQKNRALPEGRPEFCRQSVCFWLFAGIFSAFFEKTLDRNCLYHAQTPQSFNIKTFIDAYSRLTEKQKSSLTDACGVFNGAGIPVSIVEGDVSNIKITTPYDLKIAEALI